MCQVLSWVLGYKASQVALVVKNLPASARDVRNADSIPGSERAPGRRHGNPFQYSCLENPTDRGAWQEESRMAERGGRKCPVVIEQVEHTGWFVREDVRLGFSDL